MMRILQKIRISSSSYKHKFFYPNLIYSSLSLYWNSYQRKTKKNILHVYTLLYVLEKIHFFPLFPRPSLNLFDPFFPFVSHPRLFFFPFPLTLHPHTIPVRSLANFPRSSSFLLFFTCLLSFIISLSLSLTQPHLLEGERNEGRKKESKAVEYTREGVSLSPVASAAVSFLSLSSIYSPVSPLLYLPGLAACCCYYVLSYTPIPRPAPLSPSPFPRRERAKSLFSRGPLFFTVSGLPASLPRSPFHSIPTTPSPPTPSRSVCLSLTLFSSFLYFCISISLSCSFIILIPVSVSRVCFPSYQ